MTIESKKIKINKEKFCFQTGYVHNRKSKYFPPEEVDFRFRHKEFLSGDRGSITVEAALAFSLFIILIGALLGFFIVEKTQIKTLYTLNKAAEVASALEYLSTDESLQNDIDFNFLGTGVTVSDDKVEIGLTSILGIGYLPLGIGKFVISQQVVRRAWTGRTLEKIQSDREDDMYVFVTDEGSVYHLHENCTYLNPIVTETSLSEVPKLRNNDGHKYYPCPFCGGGSGTVYITGNGIRYHATRECSQLRRKYKKILLSETNLSACSKCGGYMNEE